MAVARLEALVDVANSSRVSRELVLEYITGRDILGVPACNSSPWRLVLTERTNGSHEAAAAVTIVALSALPRCDAIGPLFAADWSLGRALQKIESKMVRHDAPALRSIPPQVPAKVRRHILLFALPRKFKYGTPMHFLHLIDINVSAVAPNIDQPSISAMRPPDPETATRTICKTIANGMCEHDAGSSSEYDPAGLLPERASH
ncbi:uncharacterized protein LAESUDRAFT_757521 [Laetiporus sulphureus 93-53]|uniref:Uncharacterized protein n=1 Tax=Laetiporus sulphureus 93-53 TaxID=1314785 RepID=A0A165FDW1_9APHY|nr:uncharacterized protein LAESUDRAFT_757521 [Laetiporus sulphureus 93-53]KZT08822.1 hypothetical protein LAESUDRAFT_757521 [Laetiporus sulphureus 93-53]